MLVTFPGKLGDLLYCLPLMRELGRKFGKKPRVLTSEYCRAAVPLLEAQPYLEGASVSGDYQVESFSFGVQPWEMPAPQGEAWVYHLGLRKDLVKAEVFSRHLMETMALNLERAYGLKLVPPVNEPFLVLPETPRGGYLAFQGLGRTLAGLGQRRMLEYLPHYWATLLDLLDMPVVAFCSPLDNEFYLKMGLTPVNPGDLLAAARLVAGAAGFLGAESVGAALAQGLTAPRAVLDYFGNALPKGPRGMAFRLDREPAEVAGEFRALLDGARDDDPRYW